MKKRSEFLLRLEDGREEPIQDLEHTKRIILVDQETVGAKEMTFGYLKWEPRTSFHKRHIHQDAEEVIYIVSGKGMIGVGQEEFEAGKGDTIWIPRGVVHWAYNPFDEPSEMLLVYSRPTLTSAGYEIVE